MEDVKHDIEQVYRPITQAGKQSLKLIAKLLAKLGLKGINHYLNHSMKAIKNDGPTSETIATPPLTHEEMKEYVKKANDAGIVVGVKEMTPEGEAAFRKTNHTNKKLVSLEQKQDKLQRRIKMMRKISPVKKLYEKRLKTVQAKIKADNSLNQERRYVIYANKSRVSFMNECLEAIKKQRTTKFKENDLEDINKDGVVDEKDIGDMQARDIKMDPKDMNQVNADYGDSLYSEFTHDYCVQRVTKAEYCAMREVMFDEFSCHAAQTTASGDVLIAISESDLEEYLKIAPNKPIKEYGRKGGIDIQSVDDHVQIQHLKVANEQEWQMVKEKYKGADFMAKHNKDGSISFMIKTEDTKTVYATEQKKTTTASLSKEANEMMKEKGNEFSQTMESMDQIKDSMESLDEGVDLEC